MDDEPQMLKARLIVSQALCTDKDLSTFTGPPCSLEQKKGC
jgi:hypothetical protein